MRDGWLRSDPTGDGKAGLPSGDVAPGFGFRNARRNSVFDFDETKKTARFCRAVGFAVQKSLLLFATAETARPPSGAARLAIICCLRLRSGLCRGRGHRWLWRAVIDRCRRWVGPGFDQEAHLFAHG